MQKNQKAIQCHKGPGDCGFGREHQIYAALPLHFCREVVPVPNLWLLGHNGATLLLHQDRYEQYILSKKACRKQLYQQFLLRNEYMFCYIQARILHLILNPFLTKESMHSPHQQTIPCTILSSTIHVLQQQPTIHWHTIAAATTPCSFQKSFQAERISWKISTIKSLSAHCRKALKSSPMSYTLPKFTRYLMQLLFSFGSL